jgi:hypothetical protein
VSEPTIQRIERQFGTPKNTTTNTLDLLCRCMQAHGIRFLDHDGFGPGVRYDPERVGKEQ